MDDLNQAIIEVWKLRFKAERIKNKLRNLEWIIESDEFKTKNSEAAIKNARIVLNETKKEYAEILFDLEKLEEKANMPNPFIKKPN